MTTEATRRLHLHDAARQTWGAEAADTLMDLMPPESDTLATKADVAMVKADLAMVKADLAMVKADLRTEIAEFKAEMHKAFSEQTRTLVLAIAGMMLTTLALSFAVARIA